MRAAATNKSRSPRYIGAAPHREPPSPATHQTLLKFHYLLDNSQREIRPIIPDMGKPIHKLGIAFVMPSIGIHGDRRTKSTFVYDVQIRQRQRKSKYFSIQSSSSARIRDSEAVEAFKQPLRSIPWSEETGPVPIYCPIVPDREPPRCQKLSCQDCRILERFLLTTDPRHLNPFTDNKQQH